jgi:hypothetical protein
MDIFESGIPNLEIKKIGTWRYSYKVVQTTIVLEAWDGYFRKRWVNGKEITDEKVTLEFGVYNMNIPWDWRTQINAYHHLMQHQYEIRDNILKSLAGEVESMTMYLDPDDDFVPNVTLETIDDFDFKPFVGPVGIRFHEEESKDDFSYLEWAFLCSWDEEHGFCVTTHKERVIHIDQDTDPFKIYEDNGTLAEKEKEYDEWKKNYKPPKSQKPWWKFW